MSSRDVERSFWRRHFPTFTGTRRATTWVVEDRTFLLLRRIDEERQRLVAAAKGTPLETTWLIRYRAELRQILASGRVGPIKRYLGSNVCSREMEPLCVWLIGRLADRFRLWGLNHEEVNPSPQLRWHVAKALRRLEAWPVLERMARREPDNARLQRVALSPALRRPFRERLQKYKREVDQSHADEVATPSRMAYWARERDWEYTPPKSRDLIRRMLRRIRHWVRWGEKC